METFNIFILMDQNYEKYNNSFFNPPDIIDISYLTMIYGTQYTAFFAKGHSIIWHPV